MSVAKCFVPRLRLSLFKPRHERTVAAQASASATNVEYEALAKNERDAPRIGAAEQVRSMVANQKWSTVCTISSAPETAGFPSGAVLPYACDADGNIICSLSSLSMHRKDLDADGRASVVIASEGFDSMTQARCTVTGRFTKVSDETDAASCREAYMKTHPDAYWVDFGDFEYFRLQDIKFANLVGGMGRIAKVKGEDYAAARPDPVSPYSKPVCSHMNADHAESIIDIVREYVGVSVNSAEMLAIDRLGMDLQAMKDGDKYNIRVAWPEPAEDRKSVKDRIVAMSRAAASSKSS